MLAEIAEGPGARLCSAGIGGGDGGDSIWSGGRGRRDRGVGTQGVV
jgi:hypothetical protein